LRGLDECRDVYPERFQEPHGNGAVGTRAVDLQGAAVQEIQMPVQVEFVALGMAAEIIVVV
jgi:hypothetical protein